MNTHAFRARRRTRFSAAIVSFFVLLISANSASAISVITIYRFPSAAPTTGLVAGPDSVLYGATSTGIYRLTLDTQGHWHRAQILATPNRVGALAAFGAVLYGASTLTGTQNCPAKQASCGVILEISHGKSGWQAKPIYPFRGGNDGTGAAALSVGANGVIYGVTVSGGGSSACGSDNGKPNGCGTLFQLADVKGQWTKTILHAFKGGDDGAFPAAAPAIDAAGDIFVSTQQGGAKQPAFAGTSPESCAGNGTIFKDSKISASQVIWAWLCNAYKYGGFLLGTPHPVAATSGASVVEPAASPARALIGTATGGGDVSGCAALGNNGCGVVFLLTEPKSGKVPWNYNFVHVFQAADGASPEGSLLQANATTIYGVAPFGGVFNSACDSFEADGCGTLYRLVKSGATWKWHGAFHKFTGGSGGWNPLPGLVLYRGYVVGVTEVGGIGSACNNIGCGTIFAFKP